MTSNKKRVRLSDIIGPAFYETHKLIDMGVIDEAVESGGRASLKSSYVGTEVVLQLVKHPDCHALVTRQVGDTMRDSVYAQILWAIDKLGLTTKFKCTQSPLQCTYLPTGQRILFRGLDDPQKIKWCCTIKVDIENSKGQYIEKDKQEATKDGSESTKIQHGI